MDTTSFGKHISQQFNEELEAVRSQVLAMGGLVEQQLDRACQAFFDCDGKLAEEVIRSDYKVNALEVEIDEECSQIIARRHPAAVDLRMIITVIKIITDLERIGDEGEKVAKMALELSEEGVFGVGTQPSGIEHLSNLAKRMVHDALDAFARMDVEAAIKAARQDKKIDKEYNLLLRQLATFMMEDPRTITAVLDIIWAARAIERIGDHAKNICEYVIYLVHGRDVRHITLEQAVAKLNDQVE